MLGEILPLIHSEHQHDEIHSEWFVRHLRLLCIIPPVSLPLTQSEHQHDRIHSEWFVRHLWLLCISSQVSLPLT